jgi:tRNA dimethylallyltransferase
LIAVLGVTASGKSALAEALADHLGAVLINGDAFQVYRGMDIGTAKPTDKSRYRLLDLKEPSEGFGVGEWVTLAANEANLAYEAGQDAIVVGGTGLYIRALFEEYRDLKSGPDPEFRASISRRLETEGLAALVAELKSLDPDSRIDVANPARVKRALERLATPSEPLDFKLPPFDRIKLGIDAPTIETDIRIEERVDRMLAGGWVDEVAKLRKNGFGPGDPGFRAIGYSELWQLIAQNGSLPDARESIVRETRRYAKRQRTWMRREPHLKTIGWGDVGELSRRALTELNT